MNNNNKLLKIDDIHSIGAITENQAFDNAILKKIDYKIGFNVYIVQLGHYFGLSMLIYSNQRQIRYACDYELHHYGKTRLELVKFYLSEFNHKIFTIDEITEQPLTDYNDYISKYEFLTNYLPLTFDQVSVFDNANHTEYPYYSKITLSFYKNEKTVEALTHYDEILEEKYQKYINGDEKQLYKALVYEMFNHEAAIDWDGYEPALQALNIDYKTETPERQALIDKAYNYVCANTQYSILRSLI